MNTSLQLAAIMFSDIVGYTAMMLADGFKPTLAFVFCSLKQEDH